MSGENSSGQPWWVVVVVAFMTSALPAVLSFMASRQELHQQSEKIDQQAGDVGVASVAQAREQLDPTLTDLTQRLGEIAARLDQIERRQRSTGAGIAGQHARTGKRNDTSENSASAGTTTGPALVPDRPKPVPTGSLLSSITPADGVSDATAARLEPLAVAVRKPPALQLTVQQQRLKTQIADAAKR